MEHQIAMAVSQNYSNKKAMLKHGSELFLFVFTFFTFLFFVKIQ